MFGITNKGFKRKTYDDIVTSLTTSTQEAFGDSINVSEKSILGMFLRIIAWALSLMWQLAEHVYFSAYVKYAEGIQLDRLLANSGIMRLGQQYSRGEITIYGENGIKVPVGFIIENSNGIRYETVDEGVIRDGSITLEVRSIEKGSHVNSKAEEVNKIVTPITGIGEVINKSEITGGRDRETDSEFRRRYEKSLSSAGAGTPSSIASGVLSLENVGGVRVIENESNEFDSEGRPPHSFEVIVAGGDSLEIAEMILEKKTAGIPTFGKEVHLVKDITGTNRTIRFNYAEEVKVDVELNLKVDSDFNKSLEFAIKDAVIRYIGGTLTSGEYTVGLEIGKDIIASQVIRDLWSIEGIVDIDLRMGIAGESLKKGNLSIDTYESSVVNEVVINYV